MKSEGAFQVATALSKYKWPLNEMPVEIDEETIFEADRIIIQRTISILNRGVCGCFRIRLYLTKLFFTFISCNGYIFFFRLATKNDVDKVVIKNDESIYGCSSQVGKQNGTQIINLKDDCFTIVKIAHELYHSIGFYHEHTRRDRDTYVEVRENCIRHGDEDQFKIHPDAVS